MEPHLFRDQEDELAERRSRRREVVDLVEYREVAEGGLDLPVFIGNSAEEMHQAIDEVQKQDLENFWKKAAAVSWGKQNAVYGDATIARIGQYHGIAESTVRGWALAYERAMGLESVDRSTLMSLQKLTASHFVRGVQIKEDENYVMLLIEAHDNDWSVDKMLNTYAHMKELTGGNEREEILAPGDERYPELRQFGATVDQIETMAEALDDMDDYEREKTIEEMKSDPRVVAELAGLPAPEQKEEDPADEAARRWTKFWADVRALLGGIERQGGIGVIAEEWSEDRKEAHKAELLRLAELLQNFAEELEA